MPDHDVVGLSPEEHKGTQKKNFITLKVIMLFSFSSIT